MTQKPGRCVVCGSALFEEDGEVKCLNGCRQQQQLPDPQTKRSVGRPKSNPDNVTAPPEPEPVLPAAPPEPEPAAAAVKTKKTFKTSKNCLACTYYRHDQYGDYCVSKVCIHKHRGPIRLKYRPESGPAPAAGQDQGVNNLLTKDHDIVTLTPVHVCFVLIGKYTPENVKNFIDYLHTVHQTGQSIAAIRLIKHFETHINYLSKGGKP